MITMKPKKSRSSSREIPGSSPGEGIKPNIQKHIFSKKILTIEEFKN